MRGTGYLRIFTAFAAVLAMLLSGCGNSDGDSDGNEIPEAAELNEKSVVEIAGRKDISYYVTEVFCDGAEVQIENNSDSVLYLGSAVSVERNIGGEWQKLTSEGSGIIWGSTPAGFVKAGSSKTEIWHCGDLPDGDYRVIREAFFDDKNSSDSIALAAEFSVEASERSVYDYENERWEKENEAYLKAIENAAAEVGEKSGFEITEREDVSYSVAEASPEYVTANIENNSDMTLFWGSEFSVEKKMGGEWYTLVPIELPKGYAHAWTSEQRFMKSGDARTEEAGWLSYYGKLPAGEYRIVKRFYIDDIEHLPEYMTLAAEFTIGQPERDYQEEIRKAEEAKKIYTDKLAKFFQSEECLNAEWEFGMYMSIREDRANHAVILWNEDELGNFRGTAFDISGDRAKNIGTFAADISEDGKPSVAVGRLHGTKELYFTPLIKTETGCRLMRYPFSADSIGEGEVIAEFEGDIAEHRQETAEILADYWNRYIGNIPLRHDFERDEVVSSPYSAARSADFKCDFLDYLYFHAGYLFLPETVRTNGISVHMREEDVLAALGDPDSENDWGLTDDGYMKSFHYGDDCVDLFLDEPSGIWLVDSYVFSEFTSSIGINSGMTRQQLLDSEIGGRLFVPYYFDIIDNDKTAVENAGALTTGDWKYGGLSFIFDGDIIVGAAADNGTSM